VNSFNNTIYLELAYFENSKVYQIYSPGYCGEYLSKNKIAIFKKYIQLKNKMINVNKLRLKK